MVALLISQTPGLAGQVDLIEDIIGQSPPMKQVFDTVRRIDERVVRSVADANIGSIMGIGAPPRTGGFIQFVNTYGLQRFISRCKELSDKYGERFEAPAIVQSKMASGERFD